MSQRSPKQLLFSPRVRDHARVAFLAFVTLEIFVLPPLWETGMISPFAREISPSLTLAAGVVAVSDRRSYGILAGGIAALALAIRVLRILYPVRELLLLDSCASILAVGTLFYLLLLYVFSPVRTNWHRLVGAVVAYLLIAIIWAQAFQIVRILNPQAFDLPSPEGNFGDLVYYSFATLTTLGYGLPKGPIARSLTTIEAIAGQMFLAILIARLVSASAPKHATERTE